MLAFILMIEKDGNMANRPELNDFESVNRINNNLDEIYGRLSGWRKYLGFDGNIPRIYYNGGDRIEELIARLRGEISFIAGQLGDLTDEVKTLEEKFNELLIYIDEKIADDVSAEFDKRFNDMVNAVVEAVKDFVSDNLSKQGIDWRDLGVIAYLPYRFRGYDAWIKSSGQTYYALAGLFIDDDYYYILHQPAAFDLSDTIKDVSSIVAIYDKETLDTVSVISVGLGTCESIYVETVDENRYLYMKSNGSTLSLGKYDITNLPTDAITKVPLLKEFDIRLHMEFARFGNKWITEQVTIPRGRYNDRTTLAVWDDEFNEIQSYLHLDPQTSFYGTPYYNDHITAKRQGLVVQNGQLVQVMGGLWRTTEELTNYHMIGAQVIGADGKISEDYTFSPQVLTNYFAKQGITGIDRMEAEGAAIYKNLVHTLVTYKTGSEGENGVAILQFQSSRRDLRGEGTTGIQTTLVNRMSESSNSYLPNNRFGHLYNPYTGKEILDLKALIQYMIESRMNVINLFTSLTTINDVDGKTPLTGAYNMAIENLNNSVIGITANGYNEQYYRVIIVDNNFNITSDNIRGRHVNTTWNPVPLESGFTGTVDVRRAGDTIEVRLLGVGGNITPNTKLGTIPAEFLPFAGNSWSPAIVSDKAIINLNIQNDGDIYFGGGIVGELPADPHIWVTITLTTPI